MRLFKRTRLFQKVYDIRYESRNEMSVPSVRQPHNTIATQPFQNTES